MTRLDAPEAEEAAVLAAAQAMVAAARTAPKGRGRDLLHAMILTGAEQEAVAVTMAAIGAGVEKSPFTRDAVSLRKAQALVLLGTEHTVMGLKKCGFCGFGDCAGCRAAQGMCAFVPGDLGIAVGSAVSLAADRRMDNRIMYTAGYAALQMQLFAKDVILAYGIPLAVGGKNPFFDR